MRVEELLVTDWHKSGIGEGDIVLIHSSLKRTFKRYIELGYELNVQTILDSLIRCVGHKGTLLFPVFNFDFCEGKPFSFIRTRSQMGVLSEAARLHTGAVRTGHPVYSFSILGYHASYFENVFNESGYGADSPFATLRSLDGKIGVLDLLGQRSMTFYHHVEEMLGVPYRHHKVFEGLYEIDDGTVVKGRYSIFVRNIDQGVQTDVEPMEALLWKKSVYSGSSAYEGIGMRVIKARDMFRETSNIIADGRALGMLYRLEPMERQ